MSRYYLDASAFVKRYPFLTFLSADDRLNNAATAEGLEVDNPNHHH